MLASDIFQADIVLVERLDLRLEIAAQKAHQEVDFRLRTLLPVFLGEGVERQRRYSNAGRGFDRGTHGGDAGTMSGDARHVPPPGPTPVSVHDNGDMLGKTRPIKPQVNVSFLAVHPRRNRVSQAELSESKLTHEIQCVQCDGRAGTVLILSLNPLRGGVKSEELLVSRRICGIILLRRGSQNATTKVHKLRLTPGLFLF